MPIAAVEKRKYLPYEERRAAIIAAATDFVAEYGFKYTTWQLANHLGITQPLLYKYFRSKEDLVEAVYDGIYRSQTMVDWKEHLGDRSRPLRARLIDYLEAYTSEILDEKWIRIFLFGSLTGTDIHARFIGYLTEGVFPKIADEVRHERNLPPPQSPEELEAQIETVWGFHSSFFYIGVRQWVYRLPIPENINAVIAQRVDAFLDGAPAAFAANHKRLKAKDARTEKPTKAPARGNR